MYVVIFTATLKKQNYIKRQSKTQQIYWNNNTYSNKPKKAVKGKQKQNTEGIKRKQIKNGRPNSKHINNFIKYKQFKKTN